jgi:hypothetical protein
MPYLWLQAQRAHGSPCRHDPALRKMWSDCHMISTAGGWHEEMVVWLLEYCANN